ncbi:hypothetical protein ABZP36_003225 [Zizania latifolia]
MSLGKGKKGARNYITWTDEMDSALLEVLVEHHENGDHTQNGWKAHVYIAAIRNVREKCSIDINKDNVIARCKTFNKYYVIIIKMLSQSGFEWDWKNNKLSIDSDDVWAKYVEASVKSNEPIKNLDLSTPEEILEALEEIPEGD